MKSAVLSLLVSAQLFGTSALIKELNPKVSNERAIKLGSYIDQAAFKYGVLPKTLTAIIAHESRFKKNSISCFTRKSTRFKACYNTCDIGLGQINYDSWAKDLKLDPCRLRYDDQYNIDVTARILSKAKKANPDDPYWWSHYHDGRSRFREIYEAKLEKVFDVIEDENGE